MTEAVEVSLITGSFTFAGLVFVRIWGSLENRRTTTKLDEAQLTANQIKEELKPNSGHSTKDIVNHTAKSADALTERVGKIEGQLRDFKSEFFRYILHSARNDPLSNTRLAQEAEAFIKQLDEEKRRIKAERETTLE